MSRYKKSEDDEPNESARMEECIVEQTSSEVFPEVANKRQTKEQMDEANSTTTEQARKSIKVNTNSERAAKISRGDRPRSSSEKPRIAKEACLQEKSDYGPAINQLSTVESAELLPTSSETIESDIHSSVQKQGSRSRRKPRSDDVDIEQKREASRVSSRKSQERQKQRIEYLKQEEIRLKEVNKNQKEENYALWVLIRQIKESSPGNQNKDETASRPSQHNMEQTNHSSESNTGGIRELAQQSMLAAISSSSQSSDQGLGRRTLLTNHVSQFPLHHHDTLSITSPASAITPAIGMHIISELLSITSRQAPGNNLIPHFGSSPPPPLAAQLTGQHHAGVLSSRIPPNHQAISDPFSGFLSRLPPEQELALIEEAVRRSRAPLPAAAAGVSQGVTMNNTSYPVTNSANSALNGSAPFAAALPLLYGLENDILSRSGATRHDRQNQQQAAIMLPQQTVSRAELLRPQELIPRQEHRTQLFGDTTNQPINLSFSFQNQQQSPAQFSSFPAPETALSILSNQLTARQLENNLLARQSSSTAIRFPQFQTTSDGGVTGQNMVPGLSLEQTMAYLQELSSVPRNISRSTPVVATTIWNDPVTGGETKSEESTSGDTKPPDETPGGT